ncbi:MAG: hypothetical protein KDA90_23305 [Planctomycetaceae bacterium]|nr:hypothetical protein [Planctomycetaceae bacterium]
MKQPPAGQKSPQPWWNNRSTALWSGVDGAVRRIGWTYNPRGLVAVAAMLATDGQSP